jgi:hypothetical protein
MKDKKGNVINCIGCKALSGLSGLGNRFCNATGNKIKDVRIVQFDCPVK